MTLHEKEAGGTLRRGVYCVFVVMAVYLTFTTYNGKANGKYRAVVGAFFFLADPADIVRENSQHIAVFGAPTLKKEVLGILSVMGNPKILILLPAMFVAEMCLALTSSINS